MSIMRLEACLFRRSSIAPAACKSNNVRQWNRFCCVSRRLALMVRRVRCCVERHILAFVFTLVLFVFWVAEGWVWRLVDQ